MQNGQNELRLHSDLNELTLNKINQTGIDHIAQDGRIYASLTTISSQCGLNEYDEYDKIRASSNDAQSYFELHGIFYVDMKLVPSILNVARIRPGSDYDKRKKELITFYEPKNNYSASEIKEIKQQFQIQIDQLRNEIQSIKSKQIESSIAKEKIESIESFTTSEKLYTPTEIGALLFEDEDISAQRINKALESIGWQKRQRGTFNGKSLPGIVTRFAKDKGWMKNRVGIFENNKFRKDVEQNYITPEGLIEFKRICNQNLELFG
jgi:hypothetical protein